MLHRQGYVSTPLLCECSKQSILHVLHSLWKDKAFRVTICESILRGSQQCKMLIETTNNAWQQHRPIEKSNQEVTKSEWQIKRVPLGSVPNGTFFVPWTTPIVEPLYTRSWTNCAGWWISSNIWFIDLNDFPVSTLVRAISLNTTLGFQFGQLFLNSLLSDANLLG